jgi:hypothetical protein
MNMNLRTIMNRCLKNFRSQTHTTTLKITFASNKLVMRDFQLGPFHALSNESVCNVGEAKCNTMNCTCQHVLHELFFFVDIRVLEFVL